MNVQARADVNTGAHFFEGIRVPVRAHLIRVAGCSEGLQQLSCRRVACYATELQPELQIPHTGQDRDANNEVALVPGPLPVQAIQLQ